MTVRFARRELLRGLLSSLAAYPFVGCAARHMPPDDATFLLALARARSAVHGPGASPIGERYVQEVAPEDDTAALVGRLQGVVDLLATAPSEEEAHVELRALVASDFLDDRVHMLDGWLLSVTELEACALIWLGGA